MREIKFDYIKNFEVPESWIENVLDSPSEKKKPVVVFPKRFLYYASGIAAALVIAAVVTAYMLFGLNKDVDLVDHNTDTASKSDVYEVVTDPHASTVVDSPSELPSTQRGEEYQDGKTVTEPAEYGANTSDKTKGGSVKQQTSDSVNQNNGKGAQKPVPSAGTQPNIAETDPQASDTEEPAENDPPVTEQPATEEPKDQPVGSIVELWFTTRVDRRFIQGEAYCRIEDENGNVLGNGDLYDSSRRVFENPSYNNRVELFLLDTANLRLIPGKTYSVIFYDSRGRVLKQGLVFIDPNETTVYEI